ncbi:MAG: methyltransferase domain-containing protein [Pseudomonadales bacterium]
MSTTRETGSDGIATGRGPRVDQEALRAQVREKYRQVAMHPEAEFHFQTGRALAQRLGYPAELLAGLPDSAVESFAGVANPFSLRTIRSGERVVDAGSGGGFDSIVAAHLVGDAGEVIGVDMTPEMLDKAGAERARLGISHLSYREGLLEALPVADAWADVVISNGVFNLCADKPAVLAEAFRVLKPGGWLQFADIANGKSVPESAVDNIDLWTA